MNSNDLIVCIHPNLDIGVKGLGNAKIHVEGIALRNCDLPRGKPIEERRVKDGG
jgi:hypothetical protein